MKTKEPPAETTPQDLVDVMTSIGSLHENLTTAPAPAEVPDSLAAHIGGWSLPESGGAVAAAEPATDEEIARVLAQAEKHGLNATWNRDTILPLISRVQRGTAAIEIMNADIGKSNEGMIARWNTIADLRVSLAAEQARNRELSEELAYLKQPERTKENAFAMGVVAGEVEAWKKWNAEKSEMAATVERLEAIKEQHNRLCLADLGGDGVWPCGCHEEIMDSYGARKALTETDGEVHQECDNHRGIRAQREKLLAQSAGLREALTNCIEAGDNPSVFVEQARAALLASQPEEAKS